MAHPGFDPTVPNSSAEGAGLPGEPDLTSRLRVIGSLIDSDRMIEAKELLEGLAGAESDVLELMRLKLAVAERQLEPSGALQSVIAYLRKDPQNPIAISLYQEFSLRQYREGRSCLSHSHPPPRTR